jgi:hypothetical protein
MSFSPDGHWVVSGASPVVRGDWLLLWLANLGMSAAAIVSQETKQVVDSVQHGMAANEAAFLRGIHQTCVRQGLQVKRQCGCR